jgi:uncharacterized protein (TIGR00369 family)
MRQITKKALFLNKINRMFEAKDPDFKNRILHKMSENHFMQFIDFKLDQLEAGCVTGHLNAQKHHLQQNNFLHGGVIATLADLAAGFAAFSLVNPQQTVVTSDLKIAYLNPGIGQQFQVKGWVIKSGQKLIFGEAEITYPKPDGSVCLVAKGYCTFAVIDIT